MRKIWYVYIATNYNNSVFYTGITNDLKKRIWEHRQELDKKSFTTKYKVYKLVWFEEFATPLEAISAEKKIKDYRREKKLNIIRKLNPNFQDLNTLR